MMCHGRPMREENGQYVCDVCKGWNDPVVIALTLTRGGGDSGSCQQPPRRSVTGR